MKRWLTLIVLVIVLILLVVVQVSASDVPFTYVEIATGYLGPYGIHAADMDGDSDLDILTVESDTGAIHWWENISGDGTDLVKHVIDPDFTRPWMIRAYDVDGDDDLDVLCVNDGYDTVAWWENTNGDGTHWAYHFISDELRSVDSVLGADLDSDGDADVLVAAHNADEVAWFENADGVGLVWVKHRLIYPLERAVVVEVSDLDGDGDLDVATVGRDKVMWLENIDGDFSTHHTVFVGNSYYNRWLAAEDIDGDGDSDLVVTEEFHHTLSWFENRLDESMPWTRHQIDNLYRVHTLDSGDFDGDGDADVVATSVHANTVAWYDNLNGDGSSWDKKELSTSFVGALGLHAIDFDQDYDEDILVTGIYGNTIAWWRNDTPKPTVCFTQSDGVTPIPDTRVWYRDADWQNFGVTGEDGCVTRPDIPLATYTFRLRYEGKTQVLKQDLTIDAIVHFQTVLVTIELRSSEGLALDGGRVVYFSPRKQLIGDTIGGRVQKELLPGTYLFRMRYLGGTGYALETITQPSLISFQTGKVVSSSGTCTEYRARGWRDFEQGIELLPGEYQFRFSIGRPVERFIIVAGTENFIR